MRLRSALERQRSLLDFALGALGRRRGKTLALVAVHALLVFALASVLLFTGGLREQVRAALRGAPDLVVQRMAAGRHEQVPAGWVETLGALRGVSAARGRLWGYYFEPVSGANLTVMVPDGGWATPGGAVAGPGVARVLGLKEGDRLPLRTYDGEALDLGVAAVASPAVELVASDLLLVSEGDYRALFGAEPGRFTDVAVAVPNPDEVTRLAEKIVRMFPDARVVTRAEMIRTYDAVLDWRSGLAAAVLAGAVLAFAILAWDRASGLSAEERHELGILKALGWDTRDVLAAKAWEGAAVSLSAFAVGALAAYAHVCLGGAALLRPILEGWAALYPDLRPAPPVEPLALGTLFFLTVIPYVAATVVPCWRAATVDPDALMRGDA